jgi:hypothetical protein
MALLADAGNLPKPRDLGPASTQPRHRSVEEVRHHRNVPDIIGRQFYRDNYGMDLTRRGRPATVPTKHQPCHPLQLQPAPPMAQPMVYSCTNADQDQKGMNILPSRVCPGGVHKRHLQSKRYEEADRKDGDDEAENSRGHGPSHEFFQDSPADVDGCLNPRVSGARPLTVSRFDTSGGV